MTGKPLPEDPAGNSAPVSAEAPIICVRDVSFTYDGEAFALSGASAFTAALEALDENPYGLPVVALQDLPQHEVK